MTSLKLDSRSAFGTTLLRLAVGVVFMAHGAQKLFVMGPEGLSGFFASVGIPFPLLAAYAVTAIELIGGFAVLAGIGTRVVAALFAAIMLGAIATVHAPHGFFLPNGYEFVLVLLAASVTLVLQGAGAYALDNVLAGRKVAHGTLAEARA